MRLIKSAGLVGSFRVANIEEAIFTLTTQGARHVAVALEVEPNDLKWHSSQHKPRDYYFMRHFIAINDFRIALTQACEQSSIRLLGFIPDYYGERTSRGGSSKYIRDVICDIAEGREDISHTPDGVFALEKEGRAALFFLEIDRGTEVVSRPEKGVLKSLKFYMGYLMEGKYQRYADDFGIGPFKGFRSLYVTTSEARLQNIRQATEILEIPTKVKRFHWISTFDRIEEQTVLGPVWASIDPSDLHSYQIE